MGKLIKKIKQIINDLVKFIQYGDLPTSFYVKRGLKVGHNFNRQTGTRLDPSNCWLIEIGDDVIMGNKVQILAHDFSMMHYTGYASFGKVKIGNRVFIGANSTILKNVCIGDDVIIGSGSVVNRDVPSGCVVAGVPARIICTVAEYIEKQNAQILQSPKFDKSVTYYAGKMNDDVKKSILQSLENSDTGNVYIKFRDYKIVNGEKRTINE